MSSLAVTNLPGSGYLQLIIGGYTSCHTLWQTGATTFSPLSPFDFNPNSPVNESPFVAACQHENGQPQAWGITGELGIYTRFKMPGSTNWTDPAPMALQPPQQTYINGIAAGLSAPGRIQLFALVADPNLATYSLYTCWQLEPNTQTFTPWEIMPGAPPLEPDLLGTGGNTVLKLPDNRLQMWAVTSSNKLITRWKEATKLNAPWTAWENATLQPPVGDGILTGEVTGDGTVHLWYLNLDGDASGNSYLLNATQSTWPSASISTSWQEFAVPQNLGELNDVVVGKRNDGKLQLFILVDTSVITGIFGYAIYTSYQNGLSTSDPWTQWEQLATYNQ